MERQVALASIGTGSEPNYVKARARGKQNTAKLQSDRVVSTFIMDENVVIDYFTKITIKFQQ